VHSSIAVIKIRELQDYYDYVEYKTLNSIIESAAEGEISAEEMNSIRSNLSCQYIALQTKLHIAKFILKSTLFLNVTYKDFYSKDLAVSELIPEDIPTGIKYLAYVQLIKYHTYIGFLCSKVDGSLKKLIDGINKMEEALMKEALKSNV
jgi:hypothetical protein